MIKIHGEKALIADRTLSITNEASADPKRSAQLFGQLYDVLKNYKIAPELFLLLGRCFQELNIEIPENIRKATEFGKVLYEINLSKSCGCEARKMKWGALEEKVGAHEITKEFLYDLGYKPLTFAWEDEGR